MNNDGFPYYRVQYWNRKARVWRDLPHKFDNTADANRYQIMIGKRCRIVQITGKRTKRRLFLGAF